jgi:hypothetical protein
MGIVNTSCSLGKVNGETFTNPDAYTTVMGASALMCEAGRARFYSHDR